MTEILLNEAQLAVGCVHFPEKRTSRKDLHTSFSIFEVIITWLRDIRLRTNARLFSHSSFLHWLCHPLPSESHFYQRRRGVKASARHQCNCCSSFIWIIPRSPCWGAATALFLTLIHTEGLNYEFQPCTSAAVPITLRPLSLGTFFSCSAVFVVIDSSSWWRNLPMICTRGQFKKD